MIATGMKRVLDAILFSRAGRDKKAPEILLIAAFLSMQDPRERPFEKAKEADTAQRQFDVPESDFLSIIKLWLAADEAFRVSKSQFRKFCRAN